MFSIPSLIINQMYTYGSLKLTSEGIRFSLKNRLNDATLIGIQKVEIDKKEFPLNAIKLFLADGQSYKAEELSKDKPIKFELRKVVIIQTPPFPLDRGKHQISLHFETVEYGKLKLKVSDSIVSEEEDKKLDRVRIPCDKENNFTKEIVQKRQEFIRTYTKTNPKHIFQHSFDPQICSHNIENFAGVAQIPLGFAGPIQINGEHAIGEFIVPMATTEGTLVASYNRGIKLLNMSGGVTTTVTHDVMQRAPVFVFKSAREAVAFEKWVRDHFKEVKEIAESTTSVGKLEYIQFFQSNKMLFLRFNYTTGDAAGQNMVGRATFAACSWIQDQNKTYERFYLESNFATDKKASQINIIQTRGKRVTAEATIPRDILIDNMRVDPETLHYHSQIGTLGSLLSGANNNGAHSPNAITAIFIATGQDVANVAESSAGIVYAEITPERDLYISFTIPSLIVATYGGGTQLPTQKECLEIMGCTGKGSVRKLAEIIV
ncbi:MAG: hydroxymethylglutaryl-CoA reductase, partial [Planctomycetota bacterium]